MTGKTHSASAEILLAAMNGADICMERAILSIDEELGAGFAAAHPDLVGAFMKAVAIQYHADTIKNGLDTIAYDMEWAGQVTGGALDNLANEVANVADRIRP